MSSLLSRLLILLCIIGWIQHIDHANSNRGGNLAAKDGNAGFAKQVLRLVFVDFHLAGK